MTSCSTLLNHCSRYSVSYVGNGTTMRTYRAASQQQALLLLLLKSNSIAQTVLALPAPHVRKSAPNVPVRQVRAWSGGHSTAATCDVRLQACLLLLTNAEPQQ